MPDTIQNLKISGLTCDACVRLVTKYLSRTPGVIQILSLNQTGVAQVAVSAPLTLDTYNQSLNGTQYNVQYIS